MSIVCYVALRCVVLFCSDLICSALFCSVLFCSVLFCSILFCSVRWLFFCFKVLHVFVVNAHHQHVLVYARVPLSAVLLQGRYSYDKFGDRRSRVCVCVCVCVRVLFLFVD